MNTVILERMANHFKTHGDNISLETLKFVLARPVYKAEYNEEESLTEFAIKRNAFLEKCKNAERVILYGAGGEGIAYIGELQRVGVEILAFMDTFKTGVFCGKPIISLEEYKEKYTDIPIVITPMLKKWEIKKMLENKNIINAFYFNSESALLDIDVKIPDAEKLLNAADGEQYFSLKEISWGKNEVFVDCGVFGGETILDFIKICEKCGGSYSKIFGFEPDPLNYQGVIDILSKVRGVKLFNAGVGNHNGFEKFVLCATGSHVEKDGSTEVQILTLDKALQGERVTFLKMDIEGSELAALKGAAEIIQTQKPKLAICVYHKDEDIWEIPEYIWSLNPNYQFYLRHYSKWFNETVLYALPL